MQTSTTRTLYILCYIDRINVSFAALTMNTDLGLTAYVYGLAAGAFFWGYCLLEVPSNIILEKVGARTWIARIMISWGLLSAAIALVTGPVSFFIVRVLIGAAEAGAALVSTVTALGCALWMPRTVQRADWAVARG